MQCLDCNFHPPVYPWLNHVDNILWKAQIRKLLIIQFLPILLLILSNIQLFFPASCSQTLSINILLLGWQQFS
jgi:hypothetical protein